MLKEVLDFISNNPILGLVGMIMIVPGIFSAVHASAHRRHQRKMAEENHKRQLEILNKREAIAKHAGGAIELLMADRVLAEDFNTRLRIAIENDKKSSDGRRPTEEEPAPLTEAARTATAQS